MFRNPIVIAVAFLGFYSHSAWSYMITLSGGPAQENGGSTQTLKLAPEILKTYKANDATDTLVAGELFLGVQKPLFKNVEGQIGLAAAATSSAELSGNIWDDGDPEFNNYTYRYKVQHSHIALKGKLLANWGCPVTPWVSASLGVGFNHAYHFTNTPTISEALPNPNFTHHTVTALTYTLGIGIQRALTQHSQIGVGYEFSDWGRSQLAKAPGQTLGKGLALSHFYTNALLVNLSYG